MWNLDSYTLVIVSVLAIFLTSLLLFIESFSKRHAKTIIWAAGGLFLGGLCAVGVSLRITGYQAFWLIPAYNALIILMLACLWTSARVFQNIPPKIIWILAGPIAWVLLSLLDWFTNHDGIRIIFFNIISCFYVILFIKEIWHILPSYKPAKILLAILFMHGGFCIYRIMIVSLDGTLWIYRPEITLVLLEMPAFAISTGFILAAITRLDTAVYFKNASLTDELTSIPNRRAFMIFSKKAWGLAKMAQQNVVMMVCDVDNFKNINDSRGHIYGDRILNIVAKILHGSIRDTDLCARVGGDEFIILAPMLNIDAAKALAERLLSQVRAYEENNSSITISIGIAQVDPKAQSIETLHELADKALYAAKEQGRNCYACEIEAA